MRYKVGVAHKQQTSKNNVKGNLISDFDFFKLVVYVTSGHYDDSLRAPENSYATGRFNEILLIR
jgi:hypothetical protein